MRIAVVGGGIAGLATAFEIEQQAEQLATPVTVTVLEAGARLGGNIRTEQADGFTAEWGPNGFLANAPRTLALIEALGLTDRIARSHDAARKRFLHRHGRLHALPTGPWAFLRSGVLSRRGRMRVLLEPFGRRAPDSDESVFDFARRRIGREAAEILIDAMVSGVFAGNARTLSLQSAFPKMHAMEREYGGLVKALVKKRRAARKAGTQGPSAGGPTAALLSFETGLHELVDGLAARLGDAILLDQDISALTRTADGWSLQGETQARTFDQVVLATPAWRAAGLVADLDSGLSEHLHAIPSAPVAVVATGFRREDVGHDLDGFGFLVPRGTGPRILGSLWTSSIFADRAPADHVLQRAMIGGAQDPHALECTDAELLEAVLTDLRPILRLTAAPVWTRVFRHPHGIPQYDLGHAKRLGQIDTHLEALPGLHLTGNAYRGVAMNACIEDAAHIARRVLTPRVPD